MIKNIFFIVIIGCITACKVNGVHNISSKEFLNTMTSDDSTDIWFSQGYLLYDEEDKQLKPFNFRKGYAKLITKDSIFDFAMYYGHYKTTSCKVSGNKLRTPDKALDMQFSEGIMYLKFKGMTQQYSRDTLEHILVESYSLRKVSTADLSKLISTKDSTYSEATLFGVSINDWYIDEGSAHYQR